MIRTSASFGEVPEGAFKARCIVHIARSTLCVALTFVVILEVLVRSMRGRSVAKLVVAPGEKERRVIIDESMNGFWPL